MNSAPHPAPRHLSTANRPGMTLVEMLLVLAILGAMAGITFPVLHRVWNDQRIQEAAETVRTELAGTRNRSIDALLIYEFRYELGGNRYLVVPHEPGRVVGEETNTLGQASAGDSLYRFAGQMRPGVQFAVPGSELAELGIPVVEQSVPLADWQFDGLAGADELRGLKWSAPVLFYPDGSAQQASVRIEDETGRVMELSVRGLTGAVSVAPVREESRL